MGEQSKSEQQDRRAAPLGIRCPCDSRDALDEPCPVTSRLALLQAGDLTLPDNLIVQGSTPEYNIRVVEEALLQTDLSQQG